jgi:hypothetical protein
VRQKLVVMDTLKKQVVVLALVQEKLPKLALV